MKELVLLRKTWFSHRKCEAVSTLSALSENSANSLFPFAMYRAFLGSDYYGSSATEMFQRPDHLLPVARIVSAALPPIPRVGMNLAPILGSITGSQSVQTNITTPSSRAHTRNRSTTRTSDHYLAPQCTCLPIFTHPAASQTVWEGD